MGCIASPDMNLVSEVFGERAGAALNSAVAHICDVSTNHPATTHCSLHEEPTSSCDGNGQHQSGMNIPASTLTASEGMSMSQTQAAWLCLAAAIVSEVVGTTFLGKSAQFSRLVPTLISAAAYCASFYFISQALRSIPLGIAYAIWAGIGIILTLIIGILVFRQKPDTAAIVGVLLIVIGVVIINLFSRMSAH
jgi:small multidrug resistance pump